MPNKRKSLLQKKALRKKIRRKSGSQEHSSQREEAHEDQESAVLHLQRELGNAQVAKMLGVEPAAGDKVASWLESSANTIELPTGTAAIIDTISKDMPASEAAEMFSGLIAEIGNLEALGGAEKEGEKIDTILGACYGALAAAVNPDKPEIPGAPADADGSLFDAGANETADKIMEKLVERHEEYVEDRENKAILGFLAVMHQAETDPKIAETLLNEVYQALMKEHLSGGKNNLALNHHLTWPTPTKMTVTNTSPAES